MTVSISKAVIDKLGKLEEDSWWADNKLSTGDTLIANGKRYKFTDSDFYSNAALDAKLESITGKKIEFITDCNTNTLKYLLFKDAWSHEGKLIDANGNVVISGKVSNTPTPPSTPAPEDGYEDVLPAPLPAAPEQGYE